MKIKQLPTMLGNSYLYAFFDMRQRKPRCGCIQGVNKEEAERKVSMYYPDAKSILIGELPDNAGFSQQVKGHDIYNTLIELMNSGTVKLKDINSLDEAVSGSMIGYIDEKYMYLLPNLLFKQISEAYQGSALDYPRTIKEMYRRLRDDSIIEEQDGSMTRNKWINGRAIRLLWIPYQLIASK